MCTVAVFLQRHSRFPLIVAANRDEDRDRPFTAPIEWPGEVGFIAGRDERAGGTWMGLNERGVFVALTNHWTGTRPDPGLRSRGDLVVALLRAPDLAAARARIEQESPGDFNPCLLICADSAGAGWWTGTPFTGPEGRFAAKALGPGLHVVGNQLASAPTAKKVRRARQDFDVVTGDESPEALVAALQPALAGHRGLRLPHESLCVHWDLRRYGTVCASVLAVSPSERRWAYAHGPPCTTEMRPIEQTLDRAQ